MIEECSDGSQLNRVLQICLLVEIMKVDKMLDR